MRIDPQNPAIAGSSGTSSVDNAQSAQSKSSQQTTSATPNDTVELSSGQATVRQLVSQLSQVPEIRQEKVDSLRSAIGSGSYRPSGAQVADALAAQSLGIRETA